MTNTRLLSVLGALSTVLLGACSDNGSNPVVPTAPNSGVGASSPLVTGCGTSIETLNALAVSVFGAGSPNVNSVLGKLDNLDKKVQAGDLVGAQSQAHNIVDFVQQKAAQGSLAGTQADIAAFISGVLCYAGLSPDTFLIMPTDAPQVRLAQNGLSGVSLQGNTVTVPTLLTISTLDPNGPSPLITKLDQYPTYIDITVSSPITKDAVVAVCPSASVPAEVLNDLRLGHQASSGFELTAPAPAAFLVCTDAPAGPSAPSLLPTWLRTLSSLFIPKTLYAATRPSIGGLASEFSPYSPVDPKLKVTGIGGSATEFRPKSPGSVDASSKSTSSGLNSGVGGSSGTSARLTPGGGMLKVVGGVCTEVSAIVGTPLEPECRPVVTVTTRTLATVLENVPVAWAVTGGGGQIAPNAIATQTCGAFGATASTLTDASAKASVCWTLGPNGGPNTATATASAGGDAPAGVTFNGVEFTATGLKIDPVVTATGGNFTFDNQAHPGSGTCSNGLTPALTYSNGAPPVDKGSYTLTVTCGEGSAIYNTVTATAQIAIDLVVPAIVVSCPVSVVFDNTAQTPCTATVTAPGLSLTPTPSYTNNTNVGTATAAVSYDANGNYAAASGSATFSITAAPTSTTVSCTGSSFEFTNSPIEPCSGGTTGPGLNVPATVSYSSNVNAGTASASATFTAAGNYLGSTGSATFTITPGATTATVSCPAAATYTGAPLTPCSASVTGPGLSQSLVPAYSNNTNAGTATASASYPGGGNYQSSSDSKTFTISPAGTSVIVTCSSPGYDGAVQNPCSATASGPDFSGQAVGVTYNPLSPRNAGAYVATGSFVGGGNYSGSSNTGSFTIGQRAATATAGNATMNFGAAVPPITCSVSGLLTSDAGTVTCTASVPAITVAGNYPTTPVVSPSSPVNYAVSKVNGTLTVVGYTQVSCFASPIYSVMPPTKSAQRKGSNLPVKCTLTTPQGTPVTTANGDLQVVDRGTTGTAPPVVVFPRTNVFKVSTSGNYAYGLDTSPAGFVAGHYYYVTAFWNDGSSTTGWFLLK